MSEDTAELRTERFQTGVISICACVAFCTLIISIASCTARVDSTIHSRLQAESARLTAEAEAKKAYYEAVPATNGVLAPQDLPLTD